MVDNSRRIGPGHHGRRLLAPGPRLSRGQGASRQFEEDTGELYSQHIADAYAAAQVLLDGMERAGSIDPAAVNAAIGETDKTYVVGPVKFTEGKGKRSAALPVFMLQWQDGDLEVVYPEEWATKPLIYPIP